MSTFTDQLSARPDSHEARQTGIDDRTPALRKAADGKIDYNYYVRRGRRLRAEAAHDIAHSIGVAVRDLFRTRRNRHGTRIGTAHPA